MWNRKRKVIKYYISNMVFIGTEKNDDYRAGPAILDIYERRDSECSKEIYEKYPHEKVSCTRACYYRKEDVYTYMKDEGYEIVSPEESYKMVKPLLRLPIEKIKNSSKKDIEWAIIALDIFITNKKRAIVDIEFQDEKYTQKYIKSIVDEINVELKVFKEDKEKLQNILDELSNRKNLKLEKKHQEKELVENILSGVEKTCECGAKIFYSYNQCYCGVCGVNVEKLWSKTAKKLLKKSKENIA